MHSYKLASVASLLLTCSEAFAGDKPTRSECIAGYNLNWSSLASHPGDVGNAIMQTWPSGMAGFEALTSMRFSPKLSKLYLMLRHECKRKDEIASAFIEFLREKEFDLPVFEIVEEPIKPSPDTIDVRGPLWVDG